MSTDTIGTLEQAVADTYAWLDEVQLEYDRGSFDGRHQALQALRGVLHALRDRLSVDQNAHLSAQLPLLVRGLYYEGWDPQPLNRERHLETFLDHVEAPLRGYPEIDPAGIAMAVFAVLRRRLSAGTYEKIGNTLPRDVAILWVAEEG